MREALVAFKVRLDALDDIMCTRSFPFMRHQVSLYVIWCRKNADAILRGAISVGSVNRALPTCPRLFAESPDPSPRPPLRPAGTPGTSLRRPL
jgi:hypothetical protein